MITVIDYGSGNLRSVAKAMEKMSGRTVKVSGEAVDISSAGWLVLPGVGAFADCRHNLEQAGLVEPVLAHVRAGKPFLGICVGMQLLFTTGYEFGQHPGLDLLPGEVIPFSKEMVDPMDPNRHLKVPHMGWNSVAQKQPHPLWRNIPDNTYFYFVHSFHGVPLDPHCVAGESQYSIPFVAAVARDNIFATQFHPEKSQAHGLQLLENFVSWRP